NIRLQPVASFTKLDREARNLGGVALTGVGELTRVDGSMFTAVEAEKILDTLCYFLSFAYQDWVPPVLALGYSEDPAGTCHMYRNRPTSGRPLHRGDSIVPETGTLFQEAFERFTRQ